MTGIETALIISASVAAAGAAYGAYTGKQTADFNADMAEREAVYQRQKAQFDADKHMDSVRRMIGEQRVGFASAGVSLLSSSVEDVFGDTLTQAAVDSALIQAGGDIAASKAMVQGENYKQQGVAAIAGGVQGVGQAGMSLGNALAPPRGTAPVAPSVD